MNDSDGIGAYADAWVQVDPVRRDELLVRAWAPDGVYCDPLAVVRGRAALSEHIAVTQQSLDGGRIEVTAEAVRHHESAFFPWAMVDAAGVTVMTGFDVAQLDEQGRIT